MRQRRACARPDQASDGHCASSGRVACRNATPDQSLQESPHDRRLRACRQTAVPPTPAHGCRVRGSDMSRAISTSLREALADSAGTLNDSAAARGALLRGLVADGLAELPRPGGGATLERWRALAVVAAHDLALVKLYEGHTDALAILAEAGEPVPRRDRTWGMWAAESPGGRVVFEPDGHASCTLSGHKAWCSGARLLDAALLTVWSSAGGGPFLARVDLAQAGVAFDAGDWQAVGMRATDSVTVRFDRVPARLVGAEGFYLSRPGFWQGGVGIAGCWHGGARA